MRKDEKAPVTLYAVHEYGSDEYTFVTKRDLLGMYRTHNLIPERPQTDGKMYLHRYLRVAR